MHSRGEVMQQAVAKPISSPALPFADCTLMFGFLRQVRIIHRWWENIQTACMHSKSHPGTRMALKRVTFSTACSWQPARRRRGRPRKTQEVNHYARIAQARTTMNQPTHTPLRHPDWYINSIPLKKGKKRTWGTWGGLAAAERNAFRTWVPSVLSLYRVSSVSVGESDSN